MREVQVYIEGQRLDLFKDETISITSSIQNISDISKVFTDFSQSFTVPASKTNNQIFKHYYNNDVSDGFVAKERVAASIEINHVPFRIGKIQLEGSEIKNNEADNYKITFYGDVVTLKDKFGTRKLADLNLTGLNLDASFSNVLSNISDTSDLDYRFPLITSDRLWTYGSGTENIASTGGAITTTELFPAIKVAKIFEAIETLADVTFLGTFLTDKRFTNLFTLWKNQKEPSLNLQEVPITFNDQTSIFFLQGDGVIEVEKVTSSTVQQLVGMSGGVYQPIFGENKLEIYLYCDEVGSSFTLKLYKGDIFTGENVLYTTRIVTVTEAGFQNIAPFIVDTFSSGRYSFSFISTDIVTLYDVSVKYSITVAALLDGAITLGSFEEYMNTAYTLPPFGDAPYTTTPTIDLVQSAPDMLISDYFSGILKMFNLTCYPLQDGTFNIEPLADWYRYGGELDITQYTIDDSIKVDRPKLYKTVNFEYKESKSFLNEGFKASFDRNYGDLKAEFDFDGTDFNVKLPFENLMFERFTGTDLQVAYSMDKAEAGSSYVPAVTNLYLNESKDCSFYLTDGVTPTVINTYMPLGQDMEYNLEPNSSNFGLDNSSMTNLPVQNSLYGVYYRDYLESLFDNKTRQVTLKCIIPLIELTMLTLDDSIILRDKKYRIDSMKTDLTTGVVDLVLLSNWVETTQGTIVTPVGPVKPVTPIKPVGGTIVRPVRPVKPKWPSKPYGGGGGSYKIEADAGNTFTTTNVHLPYSRDYEIQLEITAAPNTTTLPRTDSFLITYYETDGVTEIGTEKVYINQEANISYLLQENGDYLLQEDYSKIIIE